MRDIHRNPVFYYLLIPVLVAAWPLLVWTLYLPKAEKVWEQEQQSYEEATAHILDILTKDPERLNVTKAASGLGNFTYPEAVDRVANLCRIPSGNLDLSTGKIMESRGKKTQQARVSITDISIVQSATFLSTIQSTWAYLSCDRVKLSKKKGMPDQWDMDLTFKYDY